MRYIGWIVALVVLIVGGGSWWGWSRGLWGERVSVRSSSALYRVEWSDKLAFEEYLDKIGFWDGRGVQDPAGSGRRAVPKRIIFELTDEPQGGDRLYGKGEGGRVEYRSWSVAGGEYLKVKIYLNTAAMRELPEGFVAAYLSEGMLRTSRIFTMDKTDYRDPALARDYDEYIGQGKRFVTVLAREGIDKFWHVILGEGIVQKAQAACASGGTVLCGAYSEQTRYCSGGVNDGASCMGPENCPGGSCPPFGGQCDPQQNVACDSLDSCGDNPCGLMAGCTVSGSCGFTGGGSCPPECRAGSSCGAGYSGASGCSGSGPGGGCKSNQVCCSANSCGGGGGGSVQCVPPADCPPGTVKSAVVSSAVCQPICGDNAWGTGGSPGSAQSYGECCNMEETGGGNCVWESCPTKNNPSKVCKVCDPVETWCKRDTVTTYTCIPSCTAVNPDAPTLVSPANGADIASVSVLLDWSAIADWGVACDPAYQYEVVVDTVPSPTTIYSVVDDSASSATFTGTLGQTYYWKIRAHNGSVSTDSVVRSFTIVDDIITGTIYIDADGTCSQANPGNLGGVLTVEWANDSANVASNGTYTLNASDTGTDTLTLSGIPAGYICSTACGPCSVSGITPGSNGVGNNFFLTSAREAWWQVEGAPVYAGSQAGGLTIRSQLPLTSSRLILPGAGGTAGALIRGSGSVDTGAGEISEELWNTLARYRGKRMDYNYFSAQMGVVRGQESDFNSDSLTLPSNDGREFWYSDPVAATAQIETPWVVGVGEQYVVFVNGNLRIESNITVPVGGFLAFIVSGDVIIDPSVTTLQGMYIASSDFATESAYVSGSVDDVALDIEGNIIAWGSVLLSRNLGDTNLNAPGEKFTYRPDLLTNMPDKMKTFALQWQEVVAGTLEN